MLQSLYMTKGSILRPLYVSKFEKILVFAQVLPLHQIALFIYLSRFIKEQ